jgi:hypothetical protein
MVPPSISSSPDVDLYPGCRPLKLALSLGFPTKIYTVLKGLDVLWVCLLVLLLAQGAMDIPAELQAIQKRYSSCSAGARKALITTMLTSYRRSNASVHNY